MAYSNNNAGDTKQYSGRFVERKTRDGKVSKYFSFTMEIGGYMYTCRVYAENSSCYTPTTGKNKDKLCCPVRVTRWEKQSRGSNKW